MSVLESAGSLLREARGRAGLTQGGLGRRAGVTQSVISAYESGQRQPSLPVLLAPLRASGRLLDASLVSTDIVPAAPLSGRLGRCVRKLKAEIKAIAAAHGLLQAPIDLVPEDGLKSDVLIHVEADLIAL